MPAHDEMPLEEEIVKRLGEESSVKELLLSLNRRQYERHRAMMTRLAWVGAGVWIAVLSAFWWAGYWFGIIPLRLTFIDETVRGLTSVLGGGG